MKPKTIVEDTNKTIKVGVVGFSDEKYIQSEAQCLAYVKQGLIDLGLENENVEIVSGLTNMGVPKLAYQYAKENNLKTVGISAHEALRYDCFDVDETILVGKSFGEESSYFLNYIDYLIKIGGGPQSIKEYNNFDGEDNKVEYDLEKGTYMGVRLSDDDEDHLIELCQKLNIPNITPKKDLHITLLYSRKECPDVKPVEDVNNWCYPKGLHVFETFDKKRALVLKVHSGYLVNRHNELMEEHNATYDFPEYLPHITLSYDIRDMSIPEVFNCRSKLLLTNEYVVPLKLDWCPEK